LEKKAEKTSFFLLFWHPSAFPQKRGFNKSQGKRKEGEGKRKKRMAFDVLWKGIGKEHNFEIL
jgi:hypothetical protein